MSLSRVLRLTPYRACVHTALRTTTRPVGQRTLVPSHCLSLISNADRSRMHLWEGNRRNFSSSKTKEGSSMHKSAKIGLLVLMGALLTSAGLYATEKKPTQQKTPTESALSTLIDTRVLETIRHSQEVPGLNSKEFPALKTEISKTWSGLLEKGFLEKSGADKDVRPYFVAIQGIVEHVLASELQGNVKALVGVIHTPMPATPLCSKGEISKELVTPSIESDPARLFTVKARTTIVRDYLFKGGDLHVVYPKDGYDKRTEEQQKIYKQELATYPNHLFDVPLNCASIPTDLIGATYLFQDKSGNKFIFAIKMTQAKDPQDTGNFGLWFGSVDHPGIQGRLHAVSQYLETNGVTVLKK